MITRFNGDYAFLSNMAKLSIPFEYQGLVFNSSENFYQAMKTFNINVRHDVSLLEPRASKKHMAILIKANPKNIRSDWHDIKLSVMEYILRFKFNQEPFKTLLINTGDEEILEGNYWHDIFWGVNLKDPEMPGENQLGRLLMKLRDELLVDSNKPLFGLYKPNTERPIIGSITVVNRRKEVEDVYVGRGSDLGNPFAVHNGDFDIKDSLRLYRERFIEELKNTDSKISIKSNLIQSWILNGHDIKLGCYCKKCLSSDERYFTLNHPCHGDIIKDILSL